MEVSVQGDTESAEETYRRALQEARGYASASSSTSSTPAKHRPASRFRAASRDDISAAAPDYEHPAALSADGVAPDDGLGPKLGTTKPGDRPKVAFEAGPTAAELNAAEALYREALGEARGYVKGHVKATEPPKQRPPDDVELGAYCDPAMQAQADARRAAVAQAAAEAADAKAEADARAEARATAKAEAKAEAYVLAGAMAAVEELTEADEPAEAAPEEAAPKEAAPTEEEREADLMAWIEAEAAKKADAEAAQEAELDAEEAEADADEEAQSREGGVAAAELEAAVEAALDQEQGTEASTESEAGGEAEREADDEEGISELREAPDRDATALSEARSSTSLARPRSAQDAGERAAAEKERRRRKSLEWANSLPDRRWKMSLERRSQSPFSTATGDELYEGLEWLSTAIKMAK